eukprot:11166079-Lingulodinium_polyedra.AAC.1
MELQSELCEACHECSANNTCNGTLQVQRMRWRFSDYLTMCSFHCWMDSLCFALVKSLLDGPD